MSASFVNKHLALDQIFYYKRSTILKYHILVSVIHQDKIDLHGIYCLREEKIFFENLVTSAKLYDTSSLVNE